MKEVSMRDLELLIIIPAFNEKDSILKTYKEVSLEIRKLRVNTKIIVINDGSIDATQKVLSENQIDHINLAANIGIAQVFILAVQMATTLNAEKLLIVDADGQHSASEIHKLLFSLEDNDFEKYKMGYFRRQASKTLKRVLYMKTGKIFNDPTSGFRVLRETCFPDIISAAPFLNFLEDTVYTYYILGMSTKRFVEVPVDMNIRETGEPSTTGAKLILQFLYLLVRLFRGTRKL
jgi:glycosyltransferase involved in cell wall biosynthesis